MLDAAIFLTEVSFDSTDELLSYLLGSVIAGLVGAFAMALFMKKVTASNPVRVDMVEALGSLLRGKLEGAEPVGLAVHLVVGLIWAQIYGLAILFIDPGILGGLGVGLVFGLIQGIFVTLGLMVVVSGHHPVEKYRDAPMSVGVVHLLGHLVFGASVGLCIGLFTQM